MPFAARAFTFVPVKAGETAHLLAQGLTLEGEGVGRIGERDVLCPGLFPGESAEVRIEAVSRQNPRAAARLVRLTVAHPDRREAPCERHYGRTGSCTGCALMELDEKGQRAAKVTMLKERFGLEVTRVDASPRELGYRWSSKRVVFAQRGRVMLGSYARGSHRPADMAGCLVDHPSIVRAFAEVGACATSLGIRAYDERTGEGDLRYVWAKTDGERTLVTLVVADRNARAANELAHALKEPAGVFVSEQPARENALRGSAPTLVRGQGTLETVLLGQTIEVGALGFLQPNPQVAEACYRALTAWPSEARGELAFDLYAGLGVTTRALRQHFAEVVPCESYPESARALGVPPARAEDFLARWLATEPARRPELVIANPPRKGLGDDVCRLLGELGAREVRIMSCGPAGLARDLRALSAFGYELRALRAFDTLPQTPHLELVAFLTRTEPT